MRKLISCIVPVDCNKLEPTTLSHANSRLFAECIRNRRTIHEFQTQLPPRETILEALELARWAPNHRLTEPWRFYWLGPKTIQAIAELNAALVTKAKGTRAGEIKLKRWQAIPGWIVATSLCHSDAVRAQENYAACCCAIHNIALYLWSQGIGMKWSTGEVIEQPAFYELLQIDSQQERSVGLLWYGYPATIPQQRRKPPDDYVRELP